MKTITWDMAEQFTFPVGLGAVEDVVTARVTPQWEQSDDGQSIRLTGIYHVTASVAFNPAQTVSQVHGTYIEHIDIEQSTGYFEYALPLEVDLPADKVTGPVELKVQDLKAVHDQASCQLVWQVTCNFAEQNETTVQVAMQEAAPQIEDTPQPVVASVTSAQEEVAAHEIQVEETAIPVYKETENSLDTQLEATAEPELELHLDSTSHLFIAHDDELGQQPVAQQTENSALHDDFFAELTETYSVLSVQKD
ncbi:MULTISPECIES: hypothetical protein [Metasolibacillus]|uniref:hypothetical protein n=1 Tax=Metasolibacillus TaxID=2703677 RepID=UPI00079B4ADA|nr:hypothetical protein [Metasolibacillus fluoroglycofenilyticus]KYG91634.1 hypothetical protein A0U40_01445 [[Bacillus] sp. KCTC 13219]